MSTAQTNVRRSAAWPRGLGNEDPGFAPDGRVFAGNSGVRFSRLCFQRSGVA